MSGAFNATWTLDERQRLRRRRLDLGYSQVEIARRLGIAPGSLTSIEHGFSRPSRSLHQRLIELLERLGPKPPNRPTWVAREAFRTRRLELGFSQTRVAGIVGVSMDALNGWETGRLTPTVLQQRELQRVLRRLETAPPDLRLPGGVGCPKASNEWHDTLRQRRQAVGLSQAALGLRAGMSQSTIGGYEGRKVRAATFQATRIDAVIERERTRLAAPRLRAV